MEALTTILAGLAGMMLGVWLGLMFGRRLQNVAYAWYWVANGIALLIGVAGNTAGLIYSEWWLVIASLGFVVGSLTGLKYGLGRAVGLWRVHDEIMGNDDLPKE